MNLLSITEMANELTDEIDVASAEEILSLFRQTDGQIFNGYKRFEGIQDSAFKQRFEKAVDCVSACLASVLTGEKKNKIIITGAGTSGRIAMVVAAEFNELLKNSVAEPIFEYLIAGTDVALIKAQEGAEDDPVKGMEELQAKVQGCDEFITIGITCGLSAPYVAGQLYYTIQKRNQAGILIGFCPLDRSRTNIPENWNMSFRQVLELINSHPQAHFLNPVIGPEPITGSTRMKGGSATKIILEMLLSLAILKTWSILKNEPDSHQNPPWNFQDLFYLFLNDYENSKNWVYQRQRHLAPILETAGRCLNHKGHIYYLGEGIAGQLGIVDASECPPTYGADFNDIRGFIEQGWNAFSPGSHDLSHISDLYRIDFEYFQHAVLPELTPHDLLIFTGRRSFFLRHRSFILNCQHRKANLVYIWLKETDDHHPLDFVTPNLILQAKLTDQQFPLSLYLSIKLIYNAITTVAHIFKGKVYRNRMIDLRISNNKLYYRSINIIRELLGIAAQEAETNILRAIYQTDQITDDILSAPVSQHITTAIQQERIIPLALVLTIGEYSYQAAVEHLNHQPIIRNIIRQHYQGVKP